MNMIRTIFLSAVCLTQVMGAEENVPIAEGPTKDDQIKANILSLPHAYTTKADTDPKPQSFIPLKHKTDTNSPLLWLTDTAEAGAPAVYQLHQETLDGKHDHRNISDYTPYVPTSTINLIRLAKYLLPLLGGIVGVRMLYRKISRSIDQYSQQLQNLAQDSEEYGLKKKALNRAKRFRVLLIIASIIAGGASLVTMGTRTPWYHKGFDGKTQRWTTPEAYLNAAKPTKIPA